MNVQYLRTARGRGVSVYMQYLYERNKQKGSLFCFFEGEDRKYYLQRIVRYSSYIHEMIVVYDCGGKEDVLNAHKLYMNDFDLSYKACFFVDRDYDYTLKANNFLYITPCYSIENFYSKESAFSRLLIGEFGINSHNDDHIRCLNDFKQRKKEFHDQTLILNSWLSCQFQINNTNNDICLNDFKISSYYCEISIYKLTFKKEFTEDFLRELFPKSENIPIDLLKERTLAFSTANQDEVFRGKFEFDFFIRIVNWLRLANKKGHYFSNRYNSVQIDPSINPLSTLSNYADTPVCLIQFIESL